MKRKIDIGALVDDYREHGAQGTRDRIVLAAEPIIRSIIARLTLPRTPLVSVDELYNVGVIAILQALDSFDTLRGASFVTYAYSRVRGELVDHLRRIDPLPRRRRTRVASARRTQDLLAQESGHQASDGAVAERMGLSLVDYHTVLQDSERRIEMSLTRTASEHDGLVLLDVLADETGHEGFEGFERRMVDGHVDNLVNRLSEREKTVLALYFEHGMTLAQIGEIMGVSEARISQIRKKALGFLRAHLDDEFRWAA